jgi:hypothetical protein
MGKSSRTVQGGCLLGRYSRLVAAWRSLSADLAAVEHPRAKVVATLVRGAALARE